jgi:hypothetical protein
MATATSFREWYYKRVWLLRKHLWRQTANRIEGPLEVVAVVAFAIQGFLRTPYASGISPSYQSYFFGVGLAAVVIAAIASRMKKRFRNFDKRREARFLSNISELQSELERTVLEGGTSKEENDIRLENFVRTLLRLFFSTLNIKAGLGVNIMLPNEAGTQLFIWLTYVTGPSVEMAYRAEPGVGAAGLAFRERAPVYVPNTEDRYGLLLNVPRDAGQKLRFGVVPNAYRPRENATIPDRFRSVLSVPILPASVRGQEDGAAEPPEGILNFDSPGHDPFDEVDFNMAVFFAQVLWMAIKAMENRDDSV